MPWQLRGLGARIESSRVWLARAPPLQVLLDASVQTKPEGLGPRELQLSNGSKLEADVVLWCVGRPRACLLYRLPACQAGPREHWHAPILPACSSASARSGGTRVYVCVPFQPCACHSNRVRAIPTPEQVHGPQGGLGPAGGRRPGCCA